MNKYLIVFILLVIILFTQCKTSSKIANKKNNNKAIEKEAKNTANAFFYNNYSKKFGYQLAGNEDKNFIETVETWLGVPYKYGGCSREGTDCSCFVYTFYKEFYNIVLPRKSEDMQLQSKVISENNYKTGDLIFFKINSEKISHVGIYISNRHFVHASTSKGVMINCLDENYYKIYFYKCGRIINN